MNCTIKKGLTFAAAVVFASAAWANTELQPVEEEAPARSDVSFHKSYGWTALAVGLATPVQLPWGIDKWDVFGLDINLGYSDAPKMYGLEVALGGNVARKTMMGIQAAVGFNYSNTNSYGLVFSLFNMNNKAFYGLSADAFGRNRNVYGVEVNVLGAMTEQTLGGLSVNGLANAVDGDVYGLQASIGANFARRLNGLQLAIVYNQTSMLWGGQIGLVNMATECDHGFQLGLINIIMDNQWPVLPIVNWYF